MRGLTTRTPGVSIGTRIMDWAHRHPWGGGGGEGEIKMSGDNIVCACVIISILGHRNTHTSTHLLLVFRCCWISFPHKYAQSTPWIHGSCEESTSIYYTQHTYKYPLIIFCTVNVLCMYVSIINCDTIV